MCRRALSSLDCCLAAGQAREQGWSAGKQAGKDGERAGCPAACLTAVGERGDCCDGSDKARTQRPLHAASCKCAVCGHGWPTAGAGSGGETMRCEAMQVTREAPGVWTRVWIRAAQHDSIAERRATAGVPHWAARGRDAVARSGHCWALRELIVAAPVGRGQQQ